MKRDLWFGPNVESDILALFEHPEQWESARAGISTFQVYVQNILADEPGQMGVGGNTYPALRDAHAFEQLRDWNIAIAIEAGAVKDWSCDGRQALHGILMAIDRVRDAGGEVASVVLDEPTGSRDACHLTFEQCADATALVIDGVRAHGVASVGLVEPYPYIGASDLVRFIELIQQRGASPSFWHLDVDRFGIRDQHISANKAGEDLRWFARQCEAWRIPFGVVIFGQRVQDATAYRRSAWEWAKQLRAYLHGWPDRLVAQSWEQVNGANTLPHNLPESDASSHCALVRDLHSLTA
jgi:hypothetical protein